MGSAAARRFRRLPRAKILRFEVPVASTRTSRLLGLALLNRESAGPGLLIPGCRSVHTFGMRFALDLLFIDDVGRVTDLRRGVAPNRFLRGPGASAVLELPSPRTHIVRG
jgi:uncharacterized membrane protein (UPF0127 family)